MKRLLKRRILGCCALLRCGAAPAFPDKPVRISVPFPPGGGTDALARILRVELGEMWGQRVIVDKRPRAQGNISAALKAADVQKAIFKLGRTPSPSSTEEFARQMRADNEAWGRVVKASGVKAA